MATTSLVLSSVLSLSAQVAEGLWGDTVYVGSEGNPAFAVDARPAPAVFNTAGSVKSDGWYNLSNSEDTLDNPFSPGNSVTIPGLAGTGIFSGTTMWSPFASQLNAGGGSATFRKLANGPGGGPFAAGKSMYYGGFSAEVNVDGGRLAVGDDDPLSNLSTIVFQITIGGASGYDFYNNQAPLLYINGSSVSYGADFDNLVAAAYTGTVPMPTGDEAVYVNHYAYEWDLSTIGPVDSFVIEWNGVQHAQLYSLQLDQFSSVIPEPSQYAFMFGGLVLLIVCWRKARGSHKKTIL